MMSKNEIGFSVLARISSLSLWSMVVGPSGRTVRSLLRLREAADRVHLPRIKRWCSRRLQRYGMYVAPGAKIADSVVFPHPIGIVIGEGVEVEGGVRIFQNVTLGGARIGDYQENRYPKVCSGTTIFAGAVIVGKVRIGKSCTIGANSVVLHDIPDNCVAVGAPARVVKKDNSHFQKTLAENES